MDEFCKQRWWTRTPNGSNANNEYNVNPTGANDNNNANNSNGVAPDYKKRQFQVTDKANAEPSCRESLSSSTKRKNHHIDAIHSESEIAGNGMPVSFADLIVAASQCRHNVMWKDSVAGFVKNRVQNCLELERKLADGSYCLSKYTCFKVYEPKERDIVATNIRDRVVQRAICNTSFYKDITHGFIYDNWACQTGKGTTACRKRMKQLMLRAWRMHRDETYILKVDIKNYFGSTPHWVAKAAVRKRCTDSWVADYVYRVIDSFDDVGLVGKGIGLGSQLSQLIQLAVLDDLDHVIKERLRIRCYIRYMDDMVLLGTKGQLKEALSVIVGELERLELRISERKTKLMSWRNGFTFLGFRYHFTPTGGVSMVLAKGKESAERRKLRKQLSILPIEEVDKCKVSWNANAIQGTDYAAIRRMNRFYAVERRKRKNEDQKENKRRDRERENHQEIASCERRLGSKT